MRGHKRVDLGVRTWYSHALWHPQGSGSTKTPSSRSSAIIGGPSRRAIRGTRSATCRPSSTSGSAAALPSRALPRLCARTVWQRSGWPAVARAAAASPAAKGRSLSGSPTLGGRWMRGWHTARGCGPCPLPGPASCLGIVRGEPIACSGESRGAARRCRGARRASWRRAPWWSGQRRGARGMGPRLGLS